MSTYTAFVDTKLIGSGPLEEVLRQSKEWLEHDGNALILTFEDDTGRQVDFDLRGTLAEVLERAAPPPARTGPGRPKLGVVAREISLLPRHWEWLEQQPNGASAALRRLVDQEIRNDPDKARGRRAADAAARFMTAMAGNLPGYEEATRALYQGAGDRFHELIGRWPEDIRTHLCRLARPVFENGNPVKNDSGPQINADERR